MKQNIVRWTSFLLFILFTAGKVPEPSTSTASDSRIKRYDPTDQYETRQIEGWPILVNKNFLEDRPDFCEQTFKLLRHHLYQVSRNVPASAVKKLRKVTIWVEETEPHHKFMAYHPNINWQKKS